ncbi:MAG: uncharacterized protein KVP18_003288 [Porospora cf. gigantea A]|uniref:uncharacterized protein n=1 Tax=Porospora cf. gigantea A TaxID=2853593 RepID=UPI00355A3F3E|nr:MAG: hypothetical protein KVP18_003288 [Porospora cf. gigantea A]
MTSRTRRRSEIDQLVPDSLQRTVQANDAFFNALGLERVYMDIPSEKDFEGIAHRCTSSADMIGTSADDMPAIMASVWPLQQNHIREMQTRDRKDLHDSTKEEVTDLLKEISEEDPEGLFFVLATNEGSCDRPRYRPVLGAVVQLTDDEERKIRLAFARTNFFTGKLSDCMLYELCQHFAYRVSYEAMCYEEINMQALHEEKRQELKAQQKSRVLTISDEELMHFPRAFVFSLIEDLDLVPHLEVFRQHDDDEKCKCMKAASKKREEEIVGEQKFWGAWFKRWAAAFGNGCHQASPSQELLDFFTKENRVIAKRYRTEGRDGPRDMPSCKRQKVVDVSE